MPRTEECMTYISSPLVWEDTGGGKPRLYSTPPQPSPIEEEGASTEDMEGDL